MKGAGEHMARKWRVVLERDSETGEWAVWCPELPGCVSAGATKREALRNIREAIDLSVGGEPGQSAGEKHG